MIRRRVTLDLTDEQDAVLRFVSAAYEVPWTRLVGDGVRGWLDEQAADPNVQAGLSARRRFQGRRWLRVVREDEG